MQTQTLTGIVSGFVSIVLHWLMESVAQAFSPLLMGCH
jgi:hypothetical protein